VEGKNPLAGEAALRGGFSRSGDDVGWEAFEVGLVINYQLVSVGLFEDIFGEFQLEDSQLLIDFFEERFLSIVEVSTGADKIFVESFEELTLLRVKRETISLLIDCLDSGEELRVKIYLIIMLGEGRSQVSGDGLELVIGVSRKKIFQEAAAAVEEKTAAVEGFECVGKGG
jgi:hypothetical protein